MASLNVSAAIRRLDDLAKAEYQSTFAEAISEVERALRMRRIARLTGIELKSPFAKPQTIAGPSKTGARREWHLKPELEGPDAARTLPSFQGEPAYAFVRRVFEELQQRGGQPASDTEFLNFIRGAHHESNWFYHVLDSLQPYLCEPPADAGKPSGHEARRKHFWEAVRVAADGTVDKGVELSVSGVMLALTDLVPWIVFAPETVIYGVCVFVTHYAKKGYCTANFQQEVLSILRYDNDFERR